jgi:hypothetical protein
MSGSEADHSLLSRAVVNDEQRYNSCPSIVMTWQELKVCEDHILIQLLTSGHYPYSLFLFQILKTLKLKKDDG